MKKSGKLLALFLFAVAVFILPVKVKTAESKDYGREEPVIAEMNAAEVNRMLGEASSRGNTVVAYSNSSSCKVVIHKEKGIIKVSYLIKKPEDCTKLSVEPVTLQKKSGNGWKTIVSKSESRKNTSILTGGFMYLNPKPNVTYRATANFYSTRKGKTTRYYRESGSLTF